MKKFATLLLFIVTTMLLTACGGGGGDSGSNNRDSGSANRIVLSWTAPTSRTDNSFLPFSELDGYRIYYGTTATELNMLVDLNDNSITEYTIDTLPTGDYYFAVSAYDTDGNESGMSNILNKGV
jgi:hypothetical protein